MPLVRNSRHIFNEPPTGYPVPGKTTVQDESQFIDLENVSLGGGVLVKTLVLSIDPYLRGKLRNSNEKGYLPPFEIGKPLTNWGVAVVMRSESPHFKQGDHISAIIPFQEYSVISNPDPKEVTVIENSAGIAWSHYVGFAGMPGLTSYLGWKLYSKAKKGETVFVTTGAGPVGAFVIQLAKLGGLKVIASAGSDEKVKFMKSIGADVAFNYKTTDTKVALEEHGPIDIFWDNVGGEILEVALEAANVDARFLECGMMSQYNLDGEHYGIKNLFHLIVKSIVMSGIMIPLLITPERLANFYGVVPAMIRDGRLKTMEDVKRGLEKVGEALLDVQSGKNHGKSVIIVADE